MQYAFFLHFFKETVLYSVCKDAGYTVLLVNFYTILPTSSTFFAFLTCLYH